MEYNNTLGSLLQGVSQQPPAVRPTGKVSEQVNFVSDVVEGLTSRAALTLRGGGGELTPNVDRRFSSAKLDTGTLHMAHANSELAIWDDDGSLLTVTYENASAQQYMGTDMRPFVYENEVYLLNRDKVVDKMPTATGIPFVLSTSGVVYCLGGLFSRTYVVEVRWASDGTVSRGEYTTPDGNTTGDAEKSSATYIIDELNTALSTDPNWKGSATRQTAFGYMEIRGGGEAFSLAVSDDDDETSLRAVVDVVDDIEDLPRFAAEGMLVRVAGSDAGAQDDYYVRFNVVDTDVLGQGFGRNGVWEEWYDPNQVTDWNLATLPHKLERTGNTVNVTQAQWVSRKVGDDETNPFPDIVGHKIRDIEGFQSRTVIVAGPYVAMSQTNDAFNFFKKSAATDTDADPIEIASTQQGSTTHDWIIPFDRDLVVMSDPGEGQYILNGSNALTPNNASMTKTTSFEVKGGGFAKPVTTGRTILFPFQSGGYSGIKEFFTNDEVATNGADTLTESLDKYIRGLVTRMECSTNFNMAVFQTDQDEECLYVYQYLWESTEKVQAAWYKWQFPYKVSHFNFDNSKLTIVLERTSPTSPGMTQYIFCTMDLERPENEFSGHHICLDVQETKTANALSQIASTYPGVKFVQGTGCVAPGREVTPTVTDTGGLGTVTYTFDAATVPDGAEVLVGLPYTRTLKPTMPFVRGRTGEPAHRTKVVVKGFFIEYEDTGYMKIINESRYRATPSEFAADFFPMDTDPDDPNENGIRSGVLYVPWGERSDWSEMTITSDDVRPTTIIEIEWTGEPFKGGRE